jgi:streptomycin 6-kinase
MTAILTPRAKQILIRNRRGTDGEAGVAWVEQLPSLADALTESWALTLEPSSYGFSYNYVVAVRRSDGTRAVLKIGYPGEDFRREEAALRGFDGLGSARLLESDRERSALLLEALEPGHPVSSLADDAREISATVTVIRAMSRAAAKDIPLPTFEDVIERITRRAGYLDLEGQFPWITRGLSLGRELVSNPAGLAMLLHGDLHHDNVLSSGDGWRSIDPHGVIGEQAWEIGPYLYNNLPDNEAESVWRRIIRRRADQFAEELGLDRQRVYSCAAAYTVISSVWSLEERHSESSLIKRRAVMQALAGF